MEQKVKKIIINGILKIPNLSTQNTLDFTQSNAWEPYPEQPKWQPHTSKAASRSNNFFMYSVDGATTKHNELAKYDYNLNFGIVQQFFVFLNFFSLWMSPLKKV